MAPAIGGQRGSLDAKDLDKVFPVLDHEAAPKIIDETTKTFDQGEGDACVNSSLYKLTSRTEKG